MYQLVHGLFSSSSSYSDRVREHYYKMEIENKQTTTTTDARGGDGGGGEEDTMSKKVVEKEKRDVPVPSLSSYVNVDIFVLTI